MSLLTEIQEDIIKELFNRGVGKAAKIISEMLSSQIVLSVPKLNQGSLNELATELIDKKTIGIKQKFEGEYQGDAMILYDHGSCLEVISSLLGYDELPQEFGNFERETLSEFGNIILSSCLCEFEKALECKFLTSAPKVISGNFPDDFIFSKNNNEEFMLLNMIFSLSNSLSLGRISLFINRDDIKDIAPKLDKYFERIISS
ncbi:hypothetical protein GCL60_10420 [Silvanigrella paludirubra]|jgi:chemotaxis protein CheC|uniref:CheC-like protein domain-containing protein n=1 Tax=Silvanigrella paludirubra TaxID=2499159 RepID=A0A6N6VQG4_9BACT|nr:hypothetical protein [Silvanigrella paludirubra]KAB8037582.1 hypothetical protein GCL60_10420 [Silvanigrella paludirubra]